MARWQTGEITTWRDDSEENKCYRCRRNGLALFCRVTRNERREWSTYVCLRLPVLFVFCCWIKKRDLDGAGRRGAMSVSRIYTFKWWGGGSGRGGEEEKDEEQEQEEKIMMMMMMIMNNNFVTTTTSFLYTSRPCVILFLFFKSPSTKRCNSTSVT